MTKLMFEVGGALKEDGSNAGPLLRNLQVELNSGQRLDPKLDFACYFLSTFIDDIYYNLSGDFPYRQKTHEVICKIFEEIGQNLLKLSKLIQEENTNNFLAVYESMVESYLDGLDKIRAYCNE